MEMGYLRGAKPIRDPPCPSEKEVDLGRSSQGHIPATLEELLFVFVSVTVMAQPLPLSGLDPVQGDQGAPVCGHLRIHEPTGGLISHSG